MLDFVRHGESIDNNAGIIDTTPPGTALDPTGEGQAATVATAIQHEFGTNIAGVFDSEELRTQQTAQPLLDALSTAAGHTVDATTLSGLNEIPARAPSRATQRPVSRASCTCWDHSRGRSGMY